MIELVIMNYLDSVLDVPSYIEEPEEKPDSYVLIEKTAGGKDNHVPRATIAIQSYGTTMLEAGQLNERVKEAMDLAYALPEISAAKLNSDYNFTDTGTNRYRYQAVYNIVHF